MRAFSHAYSPIGIEVSHSCVRAVQVRKGRTRPVLSAGIAWPVRTPGAFTSEDACSLAWALDRAGFVGRDVAAMAPPGAFTTTMELPPRTSAAPIQQLARVEMARIHRIEVQAFELGMWDLPTPDRRPGATHAIVVALPTEAGEALAGTFAEAGLRLICLDAPLCAYARVCDATVSHVPSLVGMIDIGWSNCRVMLMHVGSGEGTIPVYERVVEEVSLSALTKSVEEKLGLTRDAVRLTLSSSAEDVAANAPTRDLLRHARAFQGDFIDRVVSEAQRSFSYAVQLYPTLPMTAVLVTGEGHSIRGLKERLANSLGLDARDLLPADACEASESSAIRGDGSLVAALGLSLLRRDTVTQRRAA